MKVLCFDIGGTYIKYGVVENGKVIEKASVKTDAALGQQALILRLLHTTREMMKKHKVEGVGVSCAGSINIETGTVIVAPEHIKEFIGLNFKQIFKDNFGLECFADNDVNCFAVAEGESGAAKKMNSYLTMTIGTGIGGAIVIRKQIWRGSFYNGAEFGRMFISDKKYEAICSTASLVRAARKAGLSVNNGVEVFEIYDNKNHEKNALAVKIVKEFYQNLAFGIANLFYIFDPEAIIIGGGISNRQRLAKEIRQELKKILDPAFFRNAELLNAEHANDGGMIGAYYNFVKAFEKQESEN
ncbi:MAG: ROK family protein [Bacilli bacterium]|nr:ROK family protein [Bacilli bacterium]